MKADKNDLNKIYKKRFKELNWKYKHGLITKIELRKELEELCFFLNSQGYFKDLIE